MSNKRFLKTEKTIVTAYNKFRARPTVQKISRYARISRSTLYRHHEIAARILDDYEEYLLRIYSKKLRKFIQKDGYSLRVIFCQILVFILNNKSDFIILFKNGHTEIVGKMLEPLKPRLKNEWNRTTEFEKIFRLYTGEVVGVIDLWSRQDFADDRLEAVLSDILYLADTAKKHLTPLSI